MRATVLFLYIIPFISTEEVGGYTIINKIRFPFSKFFDPFMGILMAFDIKLIPSQYDTDFSWNIEANYLLPQNESEYSFPPIIGEDSERGLFSRDMLYKIIETKLDSFSEIYGGRKCLLRIICEMAVKSSKGTDVLGDVLHIVLSPTSSVDGKLSSIYGVAENYGKTRQNCKKYLKNCPIDFLTFFTSFIDLI